jgi:hypothetical protein
MRRRSDRARRRVGSRTPNVRRRVARNGISPKSDRARSASDTLAATRECRTRARARPRAHCAKRTIVRRPNLAVVAVGESVARRPAAALDVGRTTLGEGLLRRMAGARAPRTLASRRFFGGSCAILRTGSLGGPASGAHSSSARASGDVRSAVTFSSVVRSAFRGGSDARSSVARVSAQRAPSECGVPRGAIRGIFMTSVSAALAVGTVPVVTMRSMQSRPFRGDRLRSGRSLRRKSASSSGDGAE